MSRERRFTLRLRYDIPDHAEIIKIFENLNKDVHGSINQFLIDATMYYVSHFSESALVTGIELKKAKELLTRGEYEADREKLKEEIEMAVYQDLIKTILGNAVIGQPSLQINNEADASDTEQEISDAVLEDLMNWSEDD